MELHIERLNQLTSGIEVDKQSNMQRFLKKSDHCVCQIFQKDISTKGLEERTGVATAIAIFLTASVIGTGVLAVRLVRKHRVRQAVEAQNKLKAIEQGASLQRLGGQIAAIQDQGQRIQEGLQAIQDKLQDQRQEILQVIQNMQEAMQDKLQAVEDKRQAILQAMQTQMNQVTLLEIQANEEINVPEGLLLSDSTSLQNSQLDQGLGSTNCVASTAFVSDLSKFDHSSWNGSAPE